MSPRSASSTPLQHGEVKLEKRLGDVKEVPPSVPLLWDLGASLGSCWVPLGVSWGQGVRAGAVLAPEVPAALLWGTFRPRSKC